MFWKDKRVLVAGGAGFVGSNVVELLVKKGADVIGVDNLENGDIGNLAAVQDEIRFIQGDLRQIEDGLSASRDVEIVLHLAAKVRGIEFNRRHLGTMFRDNVLINTNMLEAARQNKVERFLVVSSACVYPRNCSIPTPEDEGFVGVPEPKNYGYGWAKRMTEVSSTGLCTRLRDESRACENMQCIWTEGSF